MAEEPLFALNNVDGCTTRLTRSDAEDRTVRHTDRPVDGAVKRSAAKFNHVTSYLQHLRQWRAPDAIKDEDRPT